MQVVLTEKAKKLMRLCEIEGYKNPYDFLQAVAGNSICPAICMQEGCDFTAKTEPDQEEGHCDRCGGHTMASALVIAGGSP
jgi:hypothetical protein